MTQIGALGADTVCHASVAESAVFVRNDEGARAGERRYSADLVLAVDEGYEGGDCADGGQRDVERDEGRPVRKLEDDDVAGTDAARDQAVREAPDLRLDVGIAEPSEDRVEDQLPVRILPRDVGKPVGDEANRLRVGHVTGAGSIAPRTGSTSLASASRWARRRSAGMTGARTK